VPPHLGHPLKDPLDSAIILTVTPAGYSARNQLFDATVDGRLTVARAATPLCDACRVLLAEGIVTPETRIVARHAGSNRDALRSTVGTAAGLTVADEGRGRPIFRQWAPSPYDKGKALPVTPPMRQNAEGARVVRGRL
jgi:hypothetical protein